MSSAAIVVARIRLSAKARSSGTAGLRWWQTISMSRCSATVLTVWGRVGLVEPGSTLGCPAMVMMSGAWPPPAPSVWKAWMLRPPIARSVESTKPASLRLSLCSATWRPNSSAARSAASIAAGVLPQSSCTLYAAAPPSACSRSPAALTVLPLPISRRLTGRWSSPRRTDWRCQGPGVTVVAFDPSEGPVPPPPRVVIPAASASWTWLVERKCTCRSTPPAVRMRPSPEMTSVPGPISRSGWTPSAMSGLPLRPRATIRPALMPTSARTMPQWSSTMALVMTVSRAPSALLRVPCAIDSRIDLPPPKTASSPPKVRSSSTSTHRSVSPSRTWSPVVGP